MIQTIRNAWAVPELRRKILFTIFALLIFRLGSAIPVPYINSDALELQLQLQSGTILGLMNAIEFVKPEDNAPDGALCAAVQAEALKRDLLLLNCGADHNNIRLIPPLNVDEATLDTVFQIIDESIAAALKG